MDNPETNWMPFLCRIGIHRWRWRYPLSASNYGNVICKRCSAVKKSKRGKRYEC